MIIMMIFSLLAISSRPSKIVSGLSLIEPWKKDCKLYAPYLWKNNGKLFLDPCRTPHRWGRLRVLYRYFL